MRRWLLHALFLFSLAASAQTPCVDGQAGEYSCDGIDLLAHLSQAELGFPGSDGNDLWGWTDPVTNVEYALVGTEGGTAFVDVSTPASPIVVGTLPSELTFNCLWRDIKTYADHAFIVADCYPHPMQVFDLSRLRDVTDPPETFDPDTTYQDFPDYSSHNIAINEEAGLAFPVGGSTGCSGGGLSIVDISDPQDPRDAGCYADTQSSYVHDAQCVRYSGPDAKYVGHDICFTSSVAFAAIVDVSDPSSPELINRMFYPNPSYTHQGWLMDDQSWFVVNDETDPGTTRTMFFDVSDLETADFEYSRQGPTQATDHNLYIRDGYMYQSNYTAGLRVWNMETPENENSVNEIAWFDTHPESNDHSPPWHGAWSNYPFFESGIVIVSDIDRGLFVLEPTFFPVANGPDPEMPSELLVQLSGPNPADGETALTITSPTDQELTVTLIDAHGRLLRTTASPSATAGIETTVSVNLRDLSAGTYFLRVQGEREIVTKRIAVVR